MNRPLIGVTPYFNPNRNEEYMPEGYFRAVESLGGELQIIHYEKTESELADLLPALDGVIFSGGADLSPRLYGEEPQPECGPALPQRDRMESALFVQARRRGLPILAICRGMQLANVVMGGSLYQDLPSAFPGSAHEQAAPRQALSHDVRLVPGTPLAGLFPGQETLLTNSFHHQAIRRLAPGLTVNAWADEGFPEAVTGEGPGFLLGVQWHPEVSFRTDASSRRVVAYFAEAVARFAAAD